ncbi:PEP-CTERM sorting domain-containing protein [Lentisalinibacter sediminis]|uniref:PEP-CTERM sorting domain-containing protein n=1 Tax=Lentisalinibacter sediminis TaxID=2992237 RepID=UPI00386360F4
MKTTISRMAACLAACALATTAAADPAIYDPGSLGFESQDQSMWGPGEAFQLDEEYFFGLEWDESTSFGSINNFPGTGGTITNPLYTTWSIALAGCTGLGFSRSACINGDGLLPELGEAPARRVANPVSAVPVGAEVTLATDGRVGFEFGVTIDSGSVDTAVGFDNVTATIPDAIEAGANGGLVNLNPTADLTGDDLTSQFPTLVLTSGLVFDIYAGIDGEACIGGCVPINASMNVNPDLPIVSFNEDGEGGIEWFGGDPLLEAVLGAGGVSLPTGLPAEDIPLAGGLAEVDLFLPQPNANYDGTDGTSLFASGQNDLINLTLDFDNLVSLVATQGATQNLYGGSLDLGFGSASWDFVDVDFGPALDLRQEFTLTPTLMVDLAFSRPVDYLGQMVDFVGGLEWNALPDFMFALGETLVTPTFYLGYEGQRNVAGFLNELLLDINGLLEIDLLTFGISIGKDLGILGDYTFNRSWGLGSLVEEFDIGRLSLFDLDFGLGGFSEYQASSFLVNVGEATAVSEPGSLGLLLLGLLLLAVAANRRRPAAEPAPFTANEGALA